MMRAVLAAGVLALAQALTPAPSQLRIVVIEGEDAVNIVQQKTAVRPLVEVRDRNNLPVAGATVTFTIAGGQPAAFAGGVQTLTVTTNAAGQAAASGLNAIGSGAFQIQVQAAYQGQIATAAISQTNFATAAAAAQAGGGTSGAAGGAAAGGGGGLSGTTIGIIGAAVGGGALAATQLGGGSADDGATSGDGGPGASRETSFRGPVSGQIIVTTTTTSSGGTTTCMSTRAISGTLTIRLRNGSSNGVADTTGTVTETAFTASPFCSAIQTVSFNTSADVSGGPSALTFLWDRSEVGQTGFTSSVRLGFTGALAGGAITGTLTYTLGVRGTNPVNGGVVAGNGTTEMAVTLR